MKMMFLDKTKHFSKYNNIVFKWLWSSIVLQTWKNQNILNIRDYICHCYSYRVCCRTLDGRWLLWIPVSERNQPHHDQALLRATLKLSSHRRDGEVVPGRGKLSGERNGGVEDAWLWMGSNVCFEGWFMHLKSIFGLQWKVSKTCDTYLDVLNASYLWLSHAER